MDRCECGKVKKIVYKKCFNCSGLTKCGCGGYRYVRFDTCKACKDMSEVDRLCKLCAGRLVPIGRDRANGRDHNDWVDRQYHKKCWVEMLKRSRRRSTS